MHRSERATHLISMVHFGFDSDRLYIRVDGARPMVDLLADGYEVSLKFLRPPGVRFSIRQTVGRLTARYWDRKEGRPPQWTERGPGGAAVAAGAVLEMGLPFGDLGVGPGGALSFFVAVYDAESAELERHPEHRPIDVQAPDARFEARNWNA